MHIHAVIYNHVWLCKAACEACRCRDLAEFGRLVGRLFVCLFACLPRYSFGSCLFVDCSDNCQRPVGRAIRVNEMSPAASIEHGN